jgi:hypothetical protein
VADKSSLGNGKYPPKSEHTPPTYSPPPGESRRAVLPTLSLPLSFHLLQLMAMSLPLSLNTEGIRYRPFGHGHHHTNLFSNRGLRLNGNHGRTGQLEPGVSDGVLLEKTYCGKREFSRSRSALTFSKLFLWPDAFFSPFSHSDHKHRSHYEQSVARCTCRVSVAYSIVGLVHCLSYRLLVEIGRRHAPSKTLTLTQNRWTRPGLAPFVLMRCRTLLRNYTSSR